MYLNLALGVILSLIGSACNDYVIGMFKPHDYLVAQDTFYKERLPFRSATAQYGRKFRCPITYFRVIDRLGVGRGPSVRVVRGGLQKTYIVARLTAAYNMPLSLNIYAGCENKREIPTLAPIANVTDATNATNTTDAGGVKAEAPGGGGDGAPNGENKAADAAADAAAGGGEAKPDEPPS